MKTIVFSIAMAALMVASPAFAFTQPVTTVNDGVTITNPATANLSKPATLTAVISSTSQYGEEGYVTVGDVNNGEIGYGIYVKGQWAYLVANNGMDRSQFPIAIVKPNRKITVTVTYTPGRGLDVDAFDGGEGRGVMYHWAPYTSYQQGTEFYAAAIHTTLNVDQWSYVQ